ncbi:translation initiation factor IF-2-like [Onychostruthus taczanowskii]|uniref:translation initiation factor IF-2-like n=1 Tax=Onychostruthus taczanowskii TaxID=356909 RepID=UPI001B80C854|nr:translation initiation factor IF-2-like [Onychostruthus taczanowskii]
MPDPEAPSDPGQPGPEQRPIVPRWVPALPQHHGGQVAGCPLPTLASLLATTRPPGRGGRGVAGSVGTVTRAPPRPPSAAPPCPAELQMMVEHHLCKQAQGGDDDDEVATTARCHRGDPEHRHSPGGSCPAQGGHRTPGDGTPQAGTPRAGTPQAGTPQAGTPQAGTPRAGTPGTARRSRAEDGTHIEPGDSAGSGH